MLQDLNKIKWLYLARLFSLTGSQILFFVVPLLIFKLTHSAAYTGIAFSLEWTARIISFPLSGMFADRFGARRIYIISDLLISFLALLAAIFIALYHELTIWILVVLAVSTGFLAEQGYVSAESLAPKLVPKSLYAKSQSILELLEQFALLFGPTLAGVFILYLNPDSLIYISIILYVLSGLSMVKINVVDTVNNNVSSVTDNLLVGFKEISKSMYLVNIIVLSIMMNFLFGLMTGAAPVMVLGVYAMNDKYYALLNLSAGVTGVIAIYVLNKLINKCSIVNIGVATYIITCILCLLVSIAQSYSLYVLLYAMFYAASGVFSVFFRSERARIIPPEILGRTIGAIIFITFLLFPVSGFLISLTSKYFSLSHLISFTGLTCLLLGTVLFKRTKKFNALVGDECQ